MEQRREPVYAALVAVARGIVGVQGLRTTYEGLANIPARGGAVLVANHTAYTDFLQVGLVAVKARRRARFLLKAELGENPVLRFLIRRTRSVPVDRADGHEAYEAAVAALRGGLLVAVYPEATISRSFEIKELKTGAVRMAAAAGVPIVPMVVWGAQRIWTKGVPRSIGRHRYPVVVIVGEPLDAAGDPEQVTEALHVRMTDLLSRAQEEYPDPYPAGAAWVPRRLGGAAPTLEEATALDLAENKTRLRRRATPTDDRSPDGEQPGAGEDEDGPRDRGSDGGTR